jgi:hypothetical protein
MECAEIQELLIEYPELAGDVRASMDAHTAQCARCREFLEALLAVDAQLDAQFAMREAPVAIAPAVRRRISRETALRRPSFVPELLDFVGWGAVVALAGLMAWWAGPLIPMASAKNTLTLNTALAAGGAFAVTALFIGLRSLADLKH